MTGIENPAAWARALQAANQALALREQELAALTEQLARRPVAADVAAAEARALALQAELEVLIASQRDHLAALESLQRERESALQVSNAQEKIVADGLRAQAERERAVAAKLEWLFADRTASEERIRQRHEQDLQSERQRFETLLTQHTAAHEVLQQQLREANRRLDAVHTELGSSQRQLLNVGDQHAGRLEVWRSAAEEGSARHEAALERTHGRHIEQLEAFRLELAELRTARDTAIAAVDERLQTVIDREREQRESFERLQRNLVENHERHLTQAAQQHREERETQARLAAQALEERERALQNAAEQLQIDLISSQERLISQITARHREELEDLRQRLSAAIEQLDTAQQATRSKDAQLELLSSTYTKELTALHSGWQGTIAQHAASQHRMLDAARESFDIERSRLRSELEEARTALAAALNEHRVTQEQFNAAQRTQENALEAAKTHVRQTQSALEVIEFKLSSAQDEVQRLTQQLADGAAHHSALIEAIQRDSVAPAVSAAQHFERQVQAHAAVIEALWSDLNGLQHSWIGRLFVRRRTRRPELASASPPFAVPVTSPVDATADVPDASRLAAHHVDAPASTTLPPTNDPFVAPLDMKHPSHINDLLTLPSAELVVAAYQHLLGRSPDANGYAHHLGRLLAGDGKFTVIARIASSPEALARPATLAGVPELLKEYQVSRRPLLAWWHRRQRVERALNRVEDRLDRLHAIVIRGAQLPAASATAPVQPVPISGPFPSATEPTRPPDGANIPDLPAHARRLFRRFTNQ